MGTDVMGVQKKKQASTSAQKKTIKQLARELDVPVAEISKAAQKELGLTKKKADGDYLLSPAQCRTIRMSFRKPESPDQTPLETPSDPDSEEEEERPSLEVKPDPMTVDSETVFRDSKYHVLLHPDVSKELDKYEHLRKRMGVVLPHLAAHGRTTRVKPCTGKNKGWRRSQLQGNHFYLWWTPQGSPQAKELELPPFGVLVRAIRHHDDHNPLSAGKLGEYEGLQHDELTADGIVEAPWTAEQLEFVEAQDPVRLIYGKPGSGKTTTLWKAVVERSEGRVLYLTWSRRLTEHAEEWFESNTSKEVEVVARHFTSFLGEIRGSDVPTQLLEESHLKFEAVLKSASLGAKDLGPWSKYKDALYAEIRAVLLGRAIPGGDGVSPEGAGPYWRLSDDEYKKLRGNQKNIGKPAAESLTKIVKHLERVPDFADVYPELHAATEGYKRLSEGILPDGYDRFDRIVIDEVQDLTLLEFAVIIEFCHALGTLQGHSPCILIAGDHGQSVRPSGFDWGPVKDLLTKAVTKPKDFRLEENLRCPARITRVIDRVAEEYATLEKAMKPTKQGKHSGGQGDLESKLFHVDIQSMEQLSDLLQALDEIEDVVVITPHPEAPEWEGIPEHLIETIRTPASIKGLEYQSVCLLEPGKALNSLKAKAGGKDSSMLDEQERRTAIDRLRVALSRATESLAFVDVNASKSEREKSLRLLGEEAVSCRPEELPGNFIEGDIPPEELVTNRTQEARDLIDDYPGRAWRRVVQAVELLNLVKEQDICQEARSTLLLIGARLLIDGEPEGVTRNDIDAQSGAALKGMNSEFAEVAFNHLMSWSKTRDGSPCDLLNATLALEDSDDGDTNWLRPALKPVWQRLRDGIESSSENAGEASTYSGDVERWLALTGYEGDAGTKAKELRCLAVNTLLDAEDLSGAEGVLDKVTIETPEDFLLLGRLRESQGKFSEAGDAYNNAKSDPEAIRNWRNAGEWEKAHELTEGSEHEDTEWIIGLKDIVEKRPKNLSERLGSNERKLLGEVVETVTEDAAK